MMLQMQQWMDRYLGKKGQGLTEYAIILLLVVLIGITIYSTSSLSGKINAIYTQIGNDLSTMSRNYNK